MRHDCHPQRMDWLRAGALLLLAAGACGGGSNTGGHGGGGVGGAGGGSGGGGDAGRGSADGGAAGGGAAGDAVGGGGGGGGNAGGQGGAGAPAASLEGVIGSAPIVGFSAPRSDFGAVIVANDGERIYAVESRRDIEAGPLGIPWRSRFRLAAYDGAGAAAWTFAAPPDDIVSDVAVHPSGDVTVAVLHYALDRRAYDLVRLDRDGAVLGTTTMEEPTTPPA